MSASDLAVTAPFAGVVALIPRVEGQHVGLGEPVVILEAMKHAHKVAIARIVLSGRERLVTILPIEDGFRLTTLRSAKEIREPASALEHLKVKISDDMLKMAEMIIAQKPMTFAPEAFEDRYEVALLELVKSKIAGGQPVIAKAPERGNVVNLMDALRRSIEEERRPPAPSLGKAPAGSRRARASGWNTRSLTGAGPSPGT